jgi:hypothetical protein
MNEAATLQALHDANRSRPDADVERRMRQMRASLFAPRGGSLPPQVTAEPRVGLPEVTREELDATRLRDAIACHGSLHVRGLLETRQVERLRTAIDLAYFARDIAPANPAWYDPFEGLIDGAIARAFVGAGGVHAADSPRGLFLLLDTYYELGLDRLATEFLGERPALSAEKTTLRRVQPAPAPADWHQDGQFLGKDIRSLNFWIALSDCGVDAPGLELVATRIDHIVQTGTDGAQFDWVAAHSVVESQFREALVTPTFKAGDALLFDHLMMHRTCHAPSMSKPRYAIESWFFAPSAYPAQQTGIYV